jgi:ribonuclease VapC
VENDDVVFDASALLAYILNETGFESLLFVIQRAVISTVNLAEVRTKLLDLGDRTSAMVDIAVQDIRRVDPFTEEDAIATANLRTITSHAGLSLGDRACLALALSLGVDVYTADRAWSNVDVGCQIHLIR